MRSRLQLPAAICAIVRRAPRCWRFANTSTGDYPRDAAPAMNALLDGDVATALAQQPLMGSFSLIVRLPFAALGRACRRRRPARLPARHDPLPDRGRAAGPCARRPDAPPRPVRRRLRRGRRVCAWSTRSRGRRSASATPRSCSAARCASARCWPRCAAARCRPRVLLGLALATKQWAVIAVLPVLAALPARRRARVRGRAGRRRCSSPCR